MSPSNPSPNRDVAPPSGWLATTLVSGWGAAAEPPTSHAAHLSGSYVKEQQPILYRTRIPKSIPKPHTGGEPFRGCLRLRTGGRASRRAASPCYLVRVSLPPTAPRPRSEAVTLTLSRAESARRRSSPSRHPCRLSVGAHRVGLDPHNHLGRRPHRHHQESRLAGRLRAIRVCFVFFVLTILAAFVLRC